MIDMQLMVSLNDLAWESDWNGDEVGYPEVPVVGLYSQDKDEYTYYYYIDVGQNILLEWWADYNEV